MNKFVTIVLFFTVAVASVKSFLFPDQVSSKSWSGAGYDGDYHNSESQGNSPPSYDYGHHRDSKRYGNNGGFLPAYGQHQGYDQDRRPNYPGIFSQSQANAQSTGIDSTANAQSGSQYYNDFSQSHAQAGSHRYPPTSPYFPRPNGHLGASSASSAASASSGIVNGRPVASASAAAASSGNANSASAASSSSSGSVNSPGRFQPWLNNQMFGKPSDDEEYDDPPVNDDTVVIYGK